ncbi:MAG TPA: thymidylate kinase [Acidobacteriaceae bacterium]|jgi:thymidylate kinase|nr:thymidylate kinase [Acidobacteriaceae bacterium]
MNSPRQSEASLEPGRAKSAPPRLISFSGIDGAGKSTQIAHLQGVFEAAGQRVKIVTFWDDVAVLKRLREDAGHRVFRGDKGIGTPEAPIERRDKNVRSPAMTLIRLGMYCLDAISLRRIARRALHSGADVVIFDRYLYDELANLNLSSRAMCAYVRALARLVPRPDPALILDADPVAARARKPEYPLDFLHLCRNSYLRLSEILGGLAIIAPAPVPAVKREVERQARTGARRAALRIETASSPQNETDEPKARPFAC